MLNPACWMVNKIRGQRTVVVRPDSIRLVRMVRTIGGQIWLHAPLTWPDGNARRGRSCCPASFTTSTSEVGSKGRFGRESGVP